MGKIGMLGMLMLVLAVSSVGAEGLPPGVKEILCPQTGVPSAAVQAGEISETSLDWTKNGDQFYLAQCPYQNGARLEAFWSENYAARKDACNWEWFKAKSQVGTYSTEFYLKPKYVGLGFEFAIEKDYVLVKKILPNSPAEKNSIMAGDQIVAINGKETKGMSLEEAATRLTDTSSGPTVEILIHRPDVGQYVTKVIARAEIVSEKVKFKVFSPTHFAYVGVEYPNDLSREQEDYQRWYNAAVEYIKAVEQIAVSCRQPAEASDKGPTAE